MFLIISVIVVLLVGMKGQGCDSGFGTFLLFMCVKGSDCSDLFVLDCIGEWSCESGQCSFVCEDDFKGCSDDLQCGDD